MIIEDITQALILAGGEGTRLKPITEKIPKSMVEINNKPFLEYQLELLAKNGISDVILCVGYLWEQIKDYFGDTFTSKTGSKIALKYSVEPRLLGTGGAIKNAERFIGDFFFLIYGDTFLPINYQALGQLIIKKNTIGVTSVYKNLDKIVNNNIKVDESGYVIKYNKHQASQDMTGVEAGASVFTKRLLEYLPTEIPEDHTISLEIDIYPKLIIQRQLFGYITDIRFYDIGTFERIKIISEVLR